MSEQDIYDAIVARLKAQTGKPIGDGRAPVNPEKGPFPYAVVYPQPDNEVWDDPSLSATNVVGGFQVSSVAKHRGGAQAMKQKVRTALIGWTPAVAGAGVIVLDAAGPLLPDEEFSPPLFFIPDRFAFWQPV